MYYYLIEREPGKALETSSINRFDTADDRDSYRRYWQGESPGSEWMSFETRDTIPDAYTPDPNQWQATVVLEIVLDAHSREQAERRAAILAARMRSYSVEDMALEINESRVDKVMLF